MPADRACRCEDCSQHANGFVFQPYRRWLYHNTERPLKRRRQQAAGGAATGGTASGVSRSQQHTQPVSSSTDNDEVSVHSQPHLFEHAGLGTRVQGVTVNDELLAASEESSEVGSCIDEEEDAPGLGSLARVEALEVDVFCDEDSDAGDEEGFGALPPLSATRLSPDCGSYEEEEDGEQLHPAPASMRMPSPPPQQAFGRPQQAPAWTRELYVFVLFLIAFVGVSDRLASLLITVVSGMLSRALGVASQGEEALIGGLAVHQTTPLKITVTPVAIRKALGIKDDFDRYAVCPVCATLHPWTDQHHQVSARCISCGGELLNRRRPKVAYSHRRLQTILAAVLQDRRSEDSVKEWVSLLLRQETACERTYSTLWSGSMWTADCSSDACETPCLRGHMPFVSPDMHIKISLFIDWFSPFKGRYSGSHSSGVLLMRIDNIPDSLLTLDRRCAGIHLIGVLPGPKEQTQEQLALYLQLITDELAVLNSRGVRIKTARYPEGREVRVKLGMILADSPARSKIGGIASCRTSGRGCPYCSFELRNLGKADAGAAEQRSSSHRTQSLACRSSEGRRQYHSLGVRYSMMNQVHYFNAPVMCPPDYMHAIHLGLCKRFFHKLLILGCREVGGRLNRLQEVLQRSSVPSTARKPDSRIGDPSGGNPTAHQWLTLWRHQLIFALMDVWSEALGGAGQLQLNFELKTMEVSSTRPVLFGLKPVEDVFEGAMLLVAIVDYMERATLSETEVNRLEALIKQFNRQQADLLGPGWLTYNSHIAEHIPEFIRRYGSPRNFSCYAFESFNGVLGRMRMTNRKGGALEESLMRISSLRSVLERQMEDVLPETMASQLTKFAEGNRHKLGSITETRMAKTMLEDDTLSLLFDWLNGPQKRIQGMYKRSWLTVPGCGDVGVSNKAPHFHSLVIEASPCPIRISSSLQGGSVNDGNTFVLVQVGEDRVAAQVLWLFSKRIHLGEDSAEEEDVYFAHVRQIHEASPQAALGSNHVGVELMSEVGIRFGRRGEDGQQWVLPLRYIKAQVSVCPFTSINGKFLGLKAAQLM